jgi:hypothetical protein
VPLELGIRFLLPGDPVQLLADLRRHAVEPPGAPLRSGQRHVRDRPREAAVAIVERVNRHEPEMRTAFSTGSVVAWLLNHSRNRRISSGIVGSSRPVWVSPARERSARHDRTTRADQTRHVGTPRPARDWEPREPSPAGRLAFAVACPLKGEPFGSSGYSEASSGAKKMLAEVCRRTSVKGIDLRDRLCRVRSAAGMGNDGSKWVSMGTCFGLQRPRASSAFDCSTVCA